MSGRVAVVTGAASGIGLGVANRLAADGIAVALLDRDGAGVTQAADALTGAGRAAVGHAVDVADRAALERVFSDVRQAAGADHHPRDQRRASSRSTPWPTSRPRSGIAFWR